MLWLALHLPWLPLEALPAALQAEAGTACCVIEQRRVLVANAQAQALGVLPDMSSATASSMAPQVRQFVRHDAEEEQHGADPRQHDMDACRFVGQEIRIHRPGQPTGDDGEDEEPARIHVNRDAKDAGNANSRHATSLRCREPRSETEQVKFERQAGVLTRRRRASVPRRSVRVAVYPGY